MAGTQVAPNALRGPEEECAAAWSAYSASDGDQIGGIRLGIQKDDDPAEVATFLRARLARVGLADHINRAEIGNDNGASVAFTFDRQSTHELAHESDTSRLAERLHLQSPTSRPDLETEIVVSLLLSPVEIRFANRADLFSAIRVRANIVEAARETQIEFRTDDAERPGEYWSYEDGRGFVLRHNRPLIPALEAAIRPAVSGRLYSFSCSRATEYIILLAMAREAEQYHADLLRRLTRQAEVRALKSGAFDRAFVQTYGSESQPIPVRFFIPGDRTWFRNPDRESFEVDGYEGSFTFYLGAGQFANFWKPRNTHSLRDKCVEIHSWRQATYRDAEGTLRLDDSLLNASPRA